MTKKKKKEWYGAVKKEKKKKKPKLPIEEIDIKKILRETKPELERGGLFFKRRE